MNYQLISGHFSTNEALELLTKLYYVKIKFYENKLKNVTRQEDIKNCETRIKELQKQLFEIKLNLDSENQKISMNGFIQF